jgi:hypothetical protein
MLPRKSWNYLFLSVAISQPVLCLLRSMQECEVLRRERLLLIGMMPCSGAQLTNLRLEAADCVGQIGCRRRALGRSLDLS